MTAGKFTPGSVKGRKIVKAGTHANIAAFLKAMLSGPMTKRQLADTTGIYYDTILGLIATLERENVVHICGWLPDSMGRYQTAIYTLGGGKDAEKPPKQTPAMRSAAYKRRRKAKNDSIYQPKTTFVGGSLWV